MSSHRAFWRTLSRPSSPPPGPMPNSSAKGKRPAHKVDPIDDMSCGRESARRPGYARPQTAWSTDDSYLPRAKPPPPLKLTKHQRNPSGTVSSVDPTTSTEMTTFRHTSPRASSELHPPPLSPDTETLDISSEHSSRPVIDVQHALTRSSTWVTTGSAVSSFTDTSLASSEFKSKWKWKPATNWAGPSKAVSADEHDRPKLGRSLTTRKSAESSSKGGSTQAPMRLGRIRSLRRLPGNLPDVGEPEEEASVTRGPLSPGLKVKIQCYEDRGWHEKPMADVIPKLRELKLK